MQNYLAYAEYEMNDIRMAKGSIIFDVLNRLLQIDLRTKTICVLVVLSFLFATIATFTDFWLYDMAAWPVRVPAPAAITSDTKSIKNVSEIVNRQFRSNSGLWRICCSAVECRGQCKALSEVMDNKGSSTSAYIIGTLRDSNAFPIISMLLVLFGGILFFAGRFVIEPKNATSLTAGVLFVLSGLLNVLGLIIYISNNNKLSKPGDLPSYGWSFYLAGFSFILSEISGVMVVQSNVKTDIHDDENNPDDTKMELNSCKCEPEITTTTSIPNQFQIRASRPSRICHQNSSIFRSVDLDSPFGDDDAETESNTSQIKREHEDSDASIKLRNLNKNILDSTTTLPNYGISNARSGFYGLDRIEEQIPTPNYDNEMMETTSGSSSTKQTIRADVEIPSMFTGRSRSDYKLQSNPKFSMYENDRMPMQSSKSEHDSVSSISRHFSLERTHCRPPPRRRRNSEDLDLTSLPFTSTESIQQPTMDFVLPAPPTFAGINEDNVGSSLPQQSISIFDQGGENPKPRKPRTRRPIVQRMNTFDTHSDLDERNDFSSKASLSSNTILEEEPVKRRKVSDISLRSRVLRSLQRSGYSTSTESQSIPANYLNCETTSSGEPNNSSFRCDAIEKQEELYNRRSYLPLSLPEVASCSPRSRSGISQAKSYGDSSNEIASWCDPRRRNETRGDPNRIQNTRKILKVDGDLLDLHQNRHSYYTLPHPGEPYHGENYYLPTYSDMNGNLNLVYGVNMPPTIQTNPHFDTRLPRSLSTNALNKQSTDRNQRFKKAGSVINLAKKLLSSGKTQNTSRDPDNQSTTQKLKSLLSTMNPKGGQDRLTPASVSENCSEIYNPITGSTAV
uniref:uncharacterized protein LOC120327169 isoform X1 n=1 Tax=Styela clava TaxID=7725 RepID=UPI00193A62B4|nr:uncharacterized protein LOC120327169 isoform X1 [Styela clava]